MSGLVKGSSCDFRAVSQLAYGTSRSRQTQRGVVRQREQQTDQSQRNGQGGLTAASLECNRGRQDARLTNDVAADQQTRAYLADRAAKTGSDRHQHRSATGRRKLIPDAGLACAVGTHRQHQVGIEQTQCCTRKSCDHRRASMVAN